MPTRAALVPLLVFLNVLSGTLLIPAGRPFLAAVHPGSEGGIHAFFSVNMLGAAVGAPLFAWLADRTGRARGLASALSFADAILLLACILPIPFPAVLGLRTMQGAAAVGSLSIIMSRAGASRPGGHGAAPALVGSAVVAAIAAGAPVGGWALNWGPIAPVRAAGALALAVAFGCWFLARSASGSRSASATVHDRRAILNAVRLPAAIVGVERFAVGCFVVTFSLYAHLGGVRDGDVARLFTFFLLPFALASWPLGRLAVQMDRGALLLGGLALYGMSFLMLAAVDVRHCAPVLFLAGCASAAIYGPVLCLAATRAPGTARATAMGLVNAGGTLGMLIGTAVAGVTSICLQRMGFDRADAYRVVFRIAGVSQLLVLAVALRPLARTAMVGAGETGTAGSGS